MHNARKIKIRLKTGRTVPIILPAISLAFARKGKYEPFVLAEVQDDTENVYVKIKTI